MELDMTEYDQVEEIRLIMENNGQMYCDGAASEFLVTMSSTCSEQASTEEANSENDFVFLPAPSETKAPSIITPPRSQPTTPSCAKLSSEAIVFFSQQQQQQLQHQQQPLGTLHPSNNPFQARHPKCGVQTIDYHSSHLNTCIEPSKPEGPLDCKTSRTDANKLSELMQQIVARSDSISISIPCTLCNQHVSCPPSDISSWLNHMSNEHNCKLCPICNKLIGLGHKRDLDIIKRHVVEHIDECWLDKCATKANFTFGLQQQWFSSNNCNVKDTHYKF